MKVKSSLLPALDNSVHPSSRHANARSTALWAWTYIKRSRILDSSREVGIVKACARSKGGSLWISIHLFYRNEQQIRLVHEQTCRMIERRNATILCC